MIRFAFFCCCLLILSACKSSNPLQSVQEVEKLVNKVKNKPEDIAGIVEQAKRSKTAVHSDIYAIKTLLDELKSLVGKEWGSKEIELPGRKKYVKYSNDYQARAIVDFATAKVTVETIANSNIKAKLQQAIVTTLLTPADPRDNDIFSDSAPVLGAEPFLYKQVLDQDKRAIRYQWRAQRYAQYLLSSALSQRRVDNKTIHSVAFTLVNDHQRFRQLQYSKYVLASANKYGIKPELIYAIIETESSFNPYAVSSANAYGLMQVVPSTAGRDVYAKIKKRSGQPTKAVLFNPQNNIDIGTAYLSILTRNYLAKVAHPQNREYSVISAYNGGAGNVLKTFHPNRDRAVKNINSLAPASVYWALTNKHPKAESRRYLQKVTSNQKKY